MGTPEGCMVLGGVVSTQAALREVVEVMGEGVGAVMHGGRGGDYRLRSLEKRRNGHGVDAW